MSSIYITEQGAYLRNRSGRFVATKRDDELFSVPEVSVERVILFGNIQVTSQAVVKMLDLGVELIYLSRSGRFRGRLEPGHPKNTSVRIAQYEAYLDRDFTEKMAEFIVKDKIKSEIETVRRWKKYFWIDEPKATETLSSIMHLLTTADSTGQLMGFEAMAAKSYFSTLGEALPPPFVWNGRNRRPPRDPVNSLLSLTYMLVFSEILVECYARALDPNIGFLHDTSYGRPSLAVDIIEPFRALFCDHFVIRSLQKELFSIDDFEYRDGENVRSCTLTKEGFSKYIDSFGKFLTKSDRKKVSLKMCIRNAVDRIRTSIIDRTIPEQSLTLKL